MTLTKKEIRALASRLASMDDNMQHAIALFNLATLPPGPPFKNILLSVEAEIADIKQIMQAAGEKEVRE
jgi:hypothetical protein